MVYFNFDTPRPGRYDELYPTLHCVLFNLFLSCEGVGCDREEYQIVSCYTHIPYEIFVIFGCVLTRQEEQLCFFLASTLSSSVRLLLGTTSFTQPYLMLP